MNDNLVRIKTLSNFVFALAQKSSLFKLIYPHSLVKRKLPTYDCRDLVKPYALEM